MVRGVCGCLVPSYGEVADFTVAQFDLDLRSESEIQILLQWI